MKIYHLDNYGFTLVESIFVLMLMGILAMIAIPKLEIPIKNSIQTINKYSKSGLDSGRRSVPIAKEFRLLSEKLSIRSYIFSAKDFYMINSSLPNTLADLRRFTRVSGCLKSTRKNRLRNPKDCKALGDNLSVSSWDSKNGFYWIQMFSTDARLNILAIPYIKSEKGVSACYNSFTGAVQIKSFKSKDSKITTIKC